MNIRTILSLWWIILLCINRFPIHYFSLHVLGEGLHSDIRAIVMLQRPLDLDCACYLALLREEVALCWCVLIYTRGVLRLGEAVFFEFVTLVASATFGGT